MGIPVLILGDSGSGKSASMRNFKPEEVGVFNVKRTTRRSRPSWSGCSGTSGRKWMAKAIYDLLRWAIRKEKA